MVIASLAEFQKLGRKKLSFLKVPHMTEMEVKTGDAAVGSVWNKNSWHWEEKDYNKVSHEKLVDSLNTIELHSKSGEKVEFSDITPKGFASISVRKSKKVVVFEYSISLNFKFGASNGSIKIPEFSNDELEPVLRVDCSDDSLKDLVRKDGVVAVKKALAGFVEFLNSVESGDNVIEADKKRREEELQRAKEAEIAKGLEKQKIAEAVKAREQEALSSRTFVEASVWNPNSYHWETRKLDKWASEWIKSQLSDASFTDLSVSGEAENSIRKGKKISIFNLRIEGMFRGEKFSVPSFSNEDGDDAIPKIQISSAELKNELLTELTRLVFKPFLTQLKEQ